MNYTYSFYQRDHLGNNRMVVNASKTVEEVSHYYPYGGLFGENAGSGVQPYKYNFSIERGKRKLAYSSEREKNRPKVNGKEFDGMHGLCTYDYGARQYDPVTARWDRMDPLCEKYFGISPYAYCGGNPMNLIDPDGRDWLLVTGNAVYWYGGEVGDKRNLVSGSTKNNTIFKVVNGHVLDIRH